MKHTLPYYEPIIKSTQSKSNNDIVDECVELYEAGKTHESLLRLIDFFNPEFRQKYGNAEGTALHIPHGSILIDIRLSDDEVYIYSDFLQVPNDQRLPMLRQVAEMNSSRLMLPRFVLTGDKLSIEYRCSTHQCHPYKIFTVLRNICMVGDRYDDEFCEKFGAKRCYMPHVMPYQPQEVDYIYNGIQTLCQQALEGVEKYSRQRFYGYAMQLLAATICQIYYMASPQGQLLNKINRTIGELSQDDTPILDQMKKGITALRDIQAISKDDLAHDLYHVEILASPNLRGTLQTLQKKLADVFKVALERVQFKDYEQSALRLLYVIYRLFYEYDIPDEINAVLAEGLKKASDKPFKDAAFALLETIDYLMDDDNFEDSDCSDDEAAQDDEEQLPIVE